MEYTSELTGHCRVCLVDFDSGIISLSLDEEEPNYQKTYYELLTEVPAFRDLKEAPDKLCENCGKVLGEIYRFNETLNESQNILESLTERKQEIQVLEIVESVEPEEDDDVRYMIEVDDGESIENTIEFNPEVKDGEIEQQTTFGVVVGAGTTLETDSDSIISERFQSVPVYMCAACDNDYKSEIELNKHIITKHSEQTEIQYNSDCAFEDVNMELKIFSESNKNETKNAEYFCPYCDVSKPTRARLIKHVQAMHMQQEASYECDICHKKSKTKSALYSHMKNIHILKEDFNCEYCELKYKSVSGLKYHVSQCHTNLQMLKCHLCDFETKQEFLLKRHVKRHSGTKPYECKICSSSFGSLDILKCHMLVHSDERPHVCSFCSRAYKSKSKLRAHIRNHEGYRILCPCCSINFTTNQALRTHVAKHHPEYELPPIGTVMHETKAQLPRRILNVNKR